MCGGRTLFKFHCGCARCFKFSQAELEARKQLQVETLIGYSQVDISMMNEN
jgi:hypothetical protein